MIIHRQLNTTDVPFDKNSVKEIITEMEGSVVLSVHGNSWVGPANHGRVAFTVENENDLKTQVTA